MFKAVIALTLGLWLLSSVASAAEKTVTLAVENMHCAACPYTVRARLEAVPGVVEATVFYRNKTATVVFDDELTNVEALTSATTNAGYPSALAE